MEQQNLAQRAAYYANKKREWNDMHLRVCQPCFNVTKREELYKQYLELGEWLKTEADALWTLGVNVY